jgi:RNA polymerase sigma-70 factor (ECF subfamily)
MDRDEEVAVEAQPAVLATRLIEAANPSEAFQRLLQRETGSLLRLARHLIYDREEARDLVQDTLLRAYLSLDSFRWECSLKTWVTRILINQGLKRLRRRKLSTRVASWFKTAGQSRDVPGNWAPRPSATPEEQASLKEQAGQLQLAMEKLSPKQRTVLLLRYLEGMSVQEIAETMEIGPGTVKTHLARAIRQIRSSNSRTQREVNHENL